MTYLFGSAVIGVVWSVIFYLRSDLRRDMWWSGWFYVIVMTAGFVLMHVFVADSLSEAQTINPGYWNPETLFDLNAYTQGYGLEEIPFMFFAGGIAAVLYEFFRKQRVVYEHVKSHRHVATLVAVIASVVPLLLGLNLIYSVIVFGFVGAFVMCWQRPDLITHSVFGGSIFLILYTLLYLFTLLFYPDFITEKYNFDNITGLLFLGLPLEEYLYAFGLGLMWAPLYEYRKDLVVR